MGKVKEGRKLLAALGKTKKEQMKAITPAGVKKSRTSTSVKSKAPYTRGKVMGKGDSDKFLSRRATMSGVSQASRIKDSLPKPSTSASLGLTGALAAATATGYSIGKKRGAKNARAQEAKTAREKHEAKMKEKKKERHHPNTKRTMRGRRPKK